MTSPQAQGNSWENRCMRCGNERGGFLGFVTRAPHAGARRDIGDLLVPALGSVGVVIQCKNHQQIRAADFINGLNEQRANYEARFPVTETIGAVFVPRRPHGRAVAAEQGYALTEIGQFYRMLELIKEGSG